MQGGEHIGEVGREYAAYVSNHIQSIRSSAQPLQAVWNFSADSYAGDQFVTLENGSGFRMRFDLVFYKMETELGRPRDHLYLEAKGSYDPAYVNEQFDGFLNGLLKIADILLNEREVRYFFCFVSPILPEKARDPKIFTRASTLRSVFNEGVLEQISNTDERIEALAGRVCILHLPFELSTIYPREE